MTTEDDFQSALDAEPDDWQTRLVFADWLEERGDPRADGYRALGALRRRPLLYEGPAEWGFFYACNDERRCSFEGDRGWLPKDWCDAICRVQRSPGCRDTSRAALESRAALAFAQLPEALRAELLARGRPS